MADYTYTLNGNAVHPRGEWEIEYRRNAGQIFRRRYLIGELLFENEDYDLIMGMADCDVLIFIIYCNGAEYWRGEFKFPYDFKIDTDSCFLKGTPAVVDEYTCIMNYYDQEYQSSLLFISVTNHKLVRVTNLLGGIDVDECAPIMGVIDDMLNDVDMMNCGITIKSSFINMDNFPNGDNYAAAYGTNNYMTGVTNRLDNLHIVHNYFVSFGFGDLICSSWDSERVTFKFFEDFLRDRLNAYWYIDENGEFRIEHKRFFLPGFAHSDFGTAGYDLTAIISDNGRSYAYRRNKYSYLTDQLFDQETWEWQHYFGTEGVTAHGLDFQGVPIFYGAAVDTKSDCVPGEFKNKKIITPLISSDIQWVISEYVAAATGVLECPGYFIFDVDVGAPNTIHAEQGAITGVNVANGHLSTANLQAHYFTWDRIFLTGHMNNGATPPAVEITVFDSAIRKILQEKIEFPYCCTDEFSEFDYITTHMGLGEPYSLKLNKNTLTAELLYD